MFWLGQARFCVLVRLGQVLCFGQIRRGFVFWLGQAGFCILGRLGQVSYIGWVSLGFLFWLCQVLYLVQVNKLTFVIWFSQFKFWYSSLLELMYYFAQMPLDRCQMPLWCGQVWTFSKIVTRRVLTRTLTLHVSITSSFESS